MVSLTPKSIRMVRDRLDLRNSDADQAANEFFTCLFDEAPELRALFPRQMTQQDRRKMATLGLAIRELDDFDFMLPTFRALGSEHCDPGASDAHFASYCAAMIHTMRARMGNGWTQGHRETWGQFFDALVRMMQLENTTAGGA